jgi:cytochrome c553
MNALRNFTRHIGWAACAAMLIAAAAASAVEGPDGAARDYAHRLAVGSCGTCHGVHGNSVQPKFPRLAGQNANYLVAQLKAFRAQSRGDPDAIGYMWGMAAQLDDTTIAALADFYSQQKAELPTRSSSTQITRGREIYEHGIESEGVPACSACHGPDAHGTADFPRLAGQHAQYVLKQLGSFQSNMRDVAVMHGVAQHLQESELEAIAAYLETLP